MHVIRWNPWREMDAVSGRLHRFFDDDFMPSHRLGHHSGMKSWKPAVDIYDHDDKIVLLAELPGMKKEDIHVDLENDVLTLKGERSYEHESEEDRHYRKEIFYGGFERSFTLPDGCDPDKVTADYKDGMLRIEVLKPEEKKPKKITVH